MSKTEKNKQEIEAIERRAHIGDTRHLAKGAVVFVYRIGVCSHQPDPENQELHYRRGFVRVIDKDGTVYLPAEESLYEATEQEKADFLGA